jgi:hypothetical protein
VYQFSRTKNGVELGDTSVKGALDMVSALAGNDMLVSAIGGNQHNVLGLVQHPTPFDMFDGAEQTATTQQGVACVPYRALWDLFETRLRTRDGPRFAELRHAAKCRVYHLAPPPPKSDEAHILERHETDFDRFGIVEKGVSPAALRLKLWKLHQLVLQHLCTESDIVLVSPPSEGFSPDGFLKREYYAGDATHANAEYGVLVLNHLEHIALHPSGTAAVEHA